MGFYYISFLSIVPLSIAYGLLGLLFWAVAHATRGLASRKVILPIVGVVFLILPVSEELWIAWNFGQACKEAGTFINKKVQVEGFYDDTTGWGARQLAESQYKFMESNDRLNRRLLRVEAADDASRDRALAWYREKNPNKEASKDQFIVQPLSDKEQVVVSPNGIDAWRVVTIERPTARYHFKKTYDHAKVSHEVKKFEWVITDHQNGEEVAHETTYARGPSWYFIALDRPTLFCPVSGKYGEKLVATLYTVVLEPPASR